MFCRPHLDGGGGCDFMIFARLFKTFDVFDTLRDSCNVMPTWLCAEPYVMVGFFEF